MSLHLHLLRQHGLYAKHEKCEIERQSIQFLGLVICMAGNKTDPQKVSAILNWPASTDKKVVVGFANFYRRFIKGFSAIITPITQLTEQNLRFCWNPEAQDAFKTLKKPFISALILSHPDPWLPYTLKVDATETAVGAVVSQCQGLKDLMHPMALFLCKLSPAERNYNLGDQELLTIKAALEEW